jgi:hypothetical protein
MPDLRKLRGEHSSLAAIAEKLSAMIMLAVPPPSQELHDVRMELASALDQHLKSEDCILYPALIASPEEGIALTARVFSASMGGLACEFQIYCERWSSDNIDRDWQSFQRETFEILRALSLRMLREERDLYPLLDVVAEQA